MTLLRLLVSIVVIITLVSSSWAQANDNIANATIISGSSGQISGTLVGATREVGDPTFAFYPLTGSVWYRWTAPQTGTATFRLSGKTFQSYIGAFAGSSTQDSLTVLTQHTLFGEINVNAIAGASYLIMIDRWDFPPGDLRCRGFIRRFLQSPRSRARREGAARWDSPSNYEVTFAGVPPPTGPYVAAGLPAGLSLNSGTGEISGTPLVPGVFSVVLTTTNATGTGSGTLTLAIAGPVPPADTYLFSTIAGSPGVAGAADGTGSAARFFSPSGVAVDSAGNLYVADTGGIEASAFGDTIRKIPAGVVTTLAGAPGNRGSADGSGSAARFDGPRGVAVDLNGNVNATDNNGTIRKVTPSGVVTTLAGRSAASARRMGRAIPRDSGAPEGSRRTAQVTCL